MKKGLLFLTIISLFGASSYAQLSITTTTNSPKPGETFIGHVADTTGVTAGAGGAGILWDFSNLLTNSTDTSGFVACGSTPRCDSFPGSNIVIVSNSSTTFTYMANTGTRLKTLGTYDTGSTCVNYLDPYNTLYYPFSYTSNYRDTFCYAPMSGGTDSFICDGYGTLVLPGGVHNNVLRAHITTVYRDTVMVSGVPLVSERLGEVYNWYEQGFNYPLLTMAFDTAGTAMPYLTGVKYYSKVPGLGVQQAELKNAQLHILPNPATDEFVLTFNLANTSNASVTVMDITGKHVMNVAAGQLHTGANKVQVQAGNMPAGMYFVQLQSAEGTASQKLIISK